MGSINRIDFLNCPLDPLLRSEVLDIVKQSIAAKESAKTIQFVNANKIAKIQDDSALKSLMWSADLVLTDGKPMIPMARLLGYNVPERIDGIGLMLSILDLANTNEYRVFLLGAKQPIVEACVELIKTRYPDVTIAGYRNGYFLKENWSDIAKMISRADSDIVFLGLGSPTKEELGQYLKQKDAGRIIQGVGGSFDVMAGLVKRAPIWMQDIGLEWLYRIIQEPRRMFWRYVKTNSICLGIFFKTLFVRLLY